MRVLVINSGSSSIKFQVIETEGEKVLAKGKVERIGMKGSMYSYDNYLKDISVKDKEEDFKDHTDALKLVTSLLDIEKIDAIGHRIVHGGEYFTKPTIIGEKELAELEKTLELAPLHNPGSVKGIKVCMELLPSKKNVGVFDTSFHTTIKPEKYIYPLPYKFYTDYHIRKYGFHGTSVRYVSKVADTMLQKEDSKIVVCHLGNGASVTAVRKGKSIDTSMGFTPLAGIPMGTRSGDIDPSIIEYLINKEGMSVKEVFETLNEKSGMLGLSGKSDNRDMTEIMHAGDKQAELAFNIFCARVASYIGAYFVELEGIDAIVFTGGIGENSAETRAKVCEKLKALDIHISPEKNISVGKKDMDISEDISPVRIYRIRTDEEMEIARDVKSLLHGE